MVYVLCQRLELLTMRLFFVSLILVTLTIGYLLIASPDQMVRLFPDDAFYYLQVVTKTLEHGFVIFDGINPTNGFHPLQYLTILVGVFFDGKEWLMHFAILENAILVVLASLILSRFVFPNKHQRAQVACLIVLAFSFWHLFYPT